MNNQVNAKAKEILRENLYLTISVCNPRAVPWIANLYYAYDKNYTFYWYSPKDSVHSQYIRQNPRVALAVFDSTAVGDDVDAVYIRAQAYEIEKKRELVKGLACYAKKMLRTGFVTGRAAAKRFIKQSGDFWGVSKLRMYKAVPEEVYKMAPSEMFNEKFVDSRLRVKL